MTNLNKKYNRLRLILGDQLNSQHSWFKSNDSNTLYLIAELHQESEYVMHHIQKICAFFASMKNFAVAISQAGHHCLHLNLTETEKHPDLTTLIIDKAKAYGIKEIEYQRPDEYRLVKQLRTLKPSDMKVKEVCTEHFLLPFNDLEKYIVADKHNRMETFYRKMRRRFNILMDGDTPLGGEWNYDKQNRNKLKKSDLNEIPEPLLFEKDVTDIIDRINKHQIKHFGKATNSLIWPTSRKESLALLTHFCKYSLAKFGHFQDAMTQATPKSWSLYHSRISFSLNSKMISPKEVITCALTAFEESKGDINLAQIEGFVRQILGWREYIRAVYWLNMPNYQEQNALNATTPLPSYFWDGDTKMACMSKTIEQSLDYAYSHHIQRLMITGNFSLLTGLQPNAVDAWYLGIYIDAIEWVEMPNTRGMSLFADGGLVATKPYAAGGNYINKMSDYCKGCHYNIKAKTDDNACPFNSLYWHFLHRHKKTFNQNHRLAMIYKNFEKQDATQQKAILERGQWCIDNIENL